MEKQDQAESAVGGEGDQSVLGTEGEYYSVTIWAHKDKANFFSVKYIGLPLSRTLGSWYKCLSSWKARNIHDKSLEEVKWVEIRSRDYTY